VQRSLGLIDRPAPQIGGIQEGHLFIVNVQCSGRLGGTLDDNHVVTGGLDCCGEMPARTAVQVEAGQRGHGDQFEATGCRGQCADQGPRAEIEPVLRAERVDVGPDFGGQVGGAEALATDEGTFDFGRHLLLLMASRGQVDAEQAVKT
jgi:hypothetical protein